MITHDSAMYYNIILDNRRPQLECLHSVSSNVFAQILNHVEIRCGSFRIVSNLIQSPQVLLKHLKNVILHCRENVSWFYVRYFVDGPTSVQIATLRFGTSPEENVSYAANPRKCKLRFRAFPPPP